MYKTMDKDDFIKEFKSVIESHISEIWSMYAEYVRDLEMLGYDTNDSVNSFLCAVLDTCSIK